MNSFPPAAVLVLGACFLPFFPRHTRSLIFLLFPVWAFVILLSLEPGSSLTFRFLDYDLVLYRVDRLSLAFGYVFTIIAFLGGIYSFHLKDTAQQIAALLYGGSALGVVFAGDFFTLFVF